MAASGSYMSGSDSDIDAVIIERDDISNYNPEHILPEDPETILKIRSWLQPTSYDIVGGEYRKHLASHMAGTGTWLTSSDAYQEWLKSDEHGLLWIKGIPGSGKSVIAAMLTKELANANPGCPVLFFFFRQIIEANHEPEALLRDWMDQVLDYSPPLQKQLKAYVKAGRSIQSLSREDMWKDLRTAFSNLPGKIFCVADALDEMDRGNDTFLETLGALGRWHPGKVKVLITSRPVPSVEGPLRKSSCLHIRLQEKLVDVDISTYVKHTLSKSNIKQSEWDAIANAVPGRANGLFLYAKLAMDAFQEPGADSNAVIAQLPADLNVLYTDLLQEHARRSGVAAGVQHLILQAVTHASRPLRLLELAEMVRINSPGGSLPLLKATKDLIRVACGPLLEILADETVSVIHHSFTEYLKGTTRLDDNSGYPILQLGSTHAQLAVACLRYLQAGCLNSIDIKTDNKVAGMGLPRGFFSLSHHSQIPHITNEETQLRLRYPFLEYAASNWHHHINKSEADGHDQTEVLVELRKFLGDDRKMKAWLHIRWPITENGSSLVTPLHVSAKTGLVSYTKELLETVGTKPELADAEGHTPLWWAATEGHAIVIRELIAAGADPDADGSIFGLKPLHKAAENNHPEAVKVLLEAGVDPLTPKTRDNPGPMCGNAPTTRGQTPLMYACHNGHLEALECLLPFIGDINTVHRALAWSAERGRSKLVARILQHPGVDVNAKVQGDTPLYLACGVSDVGTIKALLQAGADPCINCESSGSDYRRSVVYLPSRSPQSAPSMSCLHKICGLGARGFGGRVVDPEHLREIFLLLVQYGVDIHQRNHLGETALHGAVHSPVLTRILLDAGADVNATDRSGATPLHRAESADAISLLVEEGHADINIARSDGKTPLLNLLSTYHDESILKLLEFRPNCNAFDNHGDGPLHIYLKQWKANSTIIEALLRRGADPNLVNNDGLTPLLCVGNDKKEFARIMDLLLEAGADINAMDRNGATLLFRTISKSSNGYGKDLHNDLTDIIDRGAKIYARDFAGRTMLHEAVKTCERAVLHEPSQISRLDFLVGLGLDLKAIDYSGNGLLHELALNSNNHESHHASKIILVWEKLINLGLDLEQKNYDGRTPLHLLCATNRPNRFKQADFLPLDFVILRTKDLDNPDNCGVTPLHIAATGMETYAKKLLDAGANPAASTHEGLTPLQLAARCRESNIVGLLLGAMKKFKQEMPAIDNLSARRQDGAKSGHVHLSLNPIIGFAARSSINKMTALSYACRSGIPETVALLLEDGANVDLGEAFTKCLDFEEEDNLWQKTVQPKQCHPNGQLIAVSLNDRSRPYLDARQMTPQDLLVNETTRLEEILDMLVKYGADISKLARTMISRAVSLNRSYTAACIRAVVDKQGIDLKIKPNVDSRFSELMDNASKEASIQMVRTHESMESYGSNKSVFRHCMVRREYYLVEELARRGISFFPTPERDEISGLEVLIQHGFVSLVEKISSIGAESRLETGDWHWYGDKTKSGLWYATRNPSYPVHKGHNPVPFLLVAVRRELPNMDMVRLLIEKLGVDINEMYYNNRKTHHGYQIVPVDSVIHHVSKGENWWHVHQALPYLLKAGADINVRNDSGKTPLHIALRAYGYSPGPYHKDAARMLIEAGADVNAVDSQGQSCLALAGWDIDLTKLLIAYRARVTARAIFSAIRANNPEILQVLLSGGVDANIRPDAPTGLDGIKNNEFRPSGLEMHEEFPLYLAGSMWPSPSNSGARSPQGIESTGRLIQILLENGADPFARFLKRSPSTSRPDTSSTMVKHGYEECTVLHELFLLGKLADNYFCLPDLDVNHRDAKGRTLLHAACLGSGGPDHVIRLPKENTDHAGPVTVFQRLLFLGADIEAQDNLGWNCLHCIVSQRIIADTLQFHGSLKHIIANAPGLINQADNNGETPLHFALARARERSDTQIADLLLSAGADPLAVNKKGDSALHMLAGFLFRPKLRMLFLDLVKRGVDVNSRNALGETPLFHFYKRKKVDVKHYSYYDHQSVEQAEQDAITMLKELGANFFARDNSGQGMLHAAAIGDVNRFKQLLDMGLDVMLEDDAQRTPIDVAAACGNQEVLAIFEKKNK